MKNKIRILLLVLTFSFIATAITIKNSISDVDILNMETSTLTERIHQKEVEVDYIFQDSLLLKTFINSERYPLQVKEIAKRFADRYIFLYIYKNGKPIFWSSNTYVPETEAGFRGDVNFIKSDNFSFVVKQKKISDEVNILALVPIIKDFGTGEANKKESQFFNYLNIDNLRLANFNDSENIKNVYSRDQLYLFSVKLIEGKHNNIFLRIQLLFWTLGMLTFVGLINNICVSKARSGRPYMAIFAMAVTLTFVRILDLEANWLTNTTNLDIFNQKVYALNYFTPNLWAFLLNSLAILWLICFCIYIRKHIKIPTKLKNERLGAVIFYLALTLLYIVINLIFDRMSTLVAQSSSSSNNDMDQLFYLDNLIFIKVVIFCINILSLILLIDLTLAFGKVICRKTTINLNIQLIVLVQFLILTAIFKDFSLINVLIGLLIMIHSLDPTIFKDNNISTRVVSLITLALISTIKYADAYKSAQQEQMKDILKTLEAGEDITAIPLFYDVETEILKDNQLKKMITLSAKTNDTKVVNEYIKRKYLLGYLSKYEFNGYYYFNSKPIGNYSSDMMAEFREKVINSSIKLSESTLFYKAPSEVGSYEYFSIINIPLEDNKNATIILDFKSKDLYSYQPYESLMAETNANNYIPDNLDKVSFALYKNHNLITQKGKYTYSNLDLNYPQKSHTFTTYDGNDGFYHLIYKANKETLIIVSKPYQSYWQFIAIASIIFLILYVFTSLLQVLVSIILRYAKDDFRIHNVNYQIRVLFSKIRYSTRIQTLVITSVIIAIVISGMITFFSISYQTQKNSENQKLSFVSNLSNNLEIKVLEKNGLTEMENLTNVMMVMSDVMVAEFNLYDKNGKLFFSTQPKIYNEKLISNYINPDAYIDLNVLKKTETVNKEFIGDFNYDIYYAPIKNNNYNTVAYIGVPYFNSSEMETSSKHAILNTILNIFTIITITFAFLSVYISNKITQPLKIIGRKLAQTNLGGASNEPLYWEKNDEIGVLIKEYNYMLVKLEENAKQLRNAERESAWREMAQQVAHEIKNPLTPMKLGIQQLNRSFKENDPRLNERFERVSNSFIEQIDALAHIASEFSAFAKLPDTKLAPINILTKISKSKDVYMHNQNTTITLLNNTGMEEVMVYGDRDQLLRTFNNLLKNAIEASSNRRKHKIDIEVSLLSADLVQIIVQDNGFGIADDVLPNIFRPNFTTKSSGTGLGLAFVKQTIDGMGGKIRFETKLNIGTKFFIDIPLYKEK